MANECKSDLAQHSLTVEDPLETLPTMTSAETAPQSQTEVTEMDRWVHLVSASWKSLM